MALSLRDAWSRSLRVEPGELKQVTALTAHSFCVVGATMIGRSARDALFLERAPATWLPWMYFASALAVALVGLVYGRAVETFRRDRLAAAGALLFGVVSLALWGLVFANVARLETALAFYIAVEVMAAITILQLWTLANDIFDSRQARRIFPIIGLGGSIANIVCGGAGTALAAGWGTGSLILFCAVLLFGVSWLAIVEGRLMLGEEKVAPRRKRPPRGFSELAAHRDPHLISIALLVGATFLTTTVIDYQFKLAARAEFSGARLAAFFSAFYAVTGLLALGIQTLGTRRMLKRVGLIGTLAVLPFGLGLGSLAFFSIGRWWAAALAQGSNLTFRYTLNDASMQMLYLPMSPGLRGRAKALIEGVEKPVAIGVAALFLLLYQRAGGDLRHLSLIALGLVTGWALLLLRTRNSYLGSLEEKLRLRRLDLDEVRLAGGEAAAVLSRALASPEPAQVTHALELLPRVDVTALEAPLIALLRHPEPAIRELALGQASRLSRGPAVENAVLALLQDPDPAVRAAALRSYSGLRPDQAVPRVSPLIEDPSVLVRAASIVVLIVHGGLDGVLIAGPRLREMISSPKTTERLWGARILGEVGMRSFAEPLVGLLSDTDLEVRRAAARAAGRVGGPEFPAKLIALLGERATAPDAVEALVSLGPGIETQLGALLRDPLADRNRRLNAPRVLARLASAPAARILCEALEVSDDALRAQILIALSRLPKLSPGPDRALLQRALDSELAQTHRLLRCSQVFDLPEQAAVQSVRPGSLHGAAMLLAQALDEQRFRSLERVLLLLALLLARLRAANLHPELFRMQQSTEVVSGHRAYALELLDNLVPRELGRRLLPLWESGPREQRLADVADLYPEPARTRGDWLDWIPAGTLPWVHACALNYSMHAKHPTAAGIETTLASPDPRVREVGLTCLARLAVPVAPAVIQRLSADPDPGVRREATQFSARTAQGTIPPGRNFAPLMIPTLERVLFLKAVDLFGQLPGEELAPMAVLATEEQHAAGTDILRQGEIGDALYLVVEGRVRMHRRGRVLATLGPHDSFGEMEVLDPSPRFATVTAETDVRLLKLAETDVRDLLQEKHELALGIIQVLTRRLRTANRTKA